MSHICFEKVVLEKEKAIYCFIPKVACSSWMLKILSERGNFFSQFYTGKDPIHHDQPMQVVLAKYKIKTLCQYSDEQVEKMLKKYFKFMFVRHPLERLISGYRDKMLDLKNRIYRPIAQRIINQSANKTRQFPQFSEFLNYTLSHGKSYNDVHWAHYMDLCNPCHVEYDFVGKIESFKEDVKCVLLKIGMKPWFPLPGNPRSSENHIKKYLKNIPKSISVKIMNKWSLDLKAFGYEPRI